MAWYLKKNCGFCFATDDGYNLNYASFFSDCDYFPLAPSLTLHFSAKMANRTVKDAHTIHGTNPQYLIEKIIRSRVYECKYWKEECFALTSELLVDKAMELKYVGGVVGGNIRYG